MNTEKNYESDGSGYKALASDNYFQTLNVDTNVRWNPNSTLGLSFGASYASTESNNLTSVRTNSGFKDVTLGGDFLMYQGGFELIPEAYLIYPVSKFDKSTDDTLLGEGVKIAGAKLWFQKLWKSFNLYSSVGFEYLNEGRAYRIPYSLGAEWDNRYLDVGTEVGGFSRAGNDDYSDSEVVRTAVTDKVNGGSLKYGAVNPSLLEVKGWVNYDINESLSIKGGLSQTINGTNSAYGMTFFALINYSFLGIEKNLRPEGAAPLPPIKPFVPVQEGEVEQKDFQVAPSKTESQVYLEIQKETQPPPTDSEMSIKLKKPKKTRKTK